MTRPLGAEGSDDWRAGVGIEIWNLRQKAVTFVTYERCEGGRLGTSTDFGLDPNLENHELGEQSAGPTMHLANNSPRYDAVSQALHWITAVLIIVLLLTGKVGDIDADEPSSALFMWHGSLGILVLLVAAVRIIWLFVNPAPPLPQGMKRVSRVLARGMHLALYVLLFALPLSGWLASSAEGAPLNFFGIASLPAWQMHIPRQETPLTASGSEAAEAKESGESTEELFEDVHEVLGNVLLALASLHILAAFKHQLIDRDGLLSRMLPRAGWLRTGRPAQSVRMPRGP